jgi:3-phosphoglycerate kinase
MKDYSQEIIQQIAQKDAFPLMVGGGSVAAFSLADIATVAQQIGVIGGAVLVFVTLAHRVYIFWKDTRK